MISQESDVRCPKAYRLVRWIASRFFPGDPDAQDTVVSLAWYAMEVKQNKCHAFQAARYACYKVMQGRDLPGCGLGSKRDVYNRLKRKSGGASGPLKSKRPAPDRLAAWREAWSLLLSQLDAKKRQALEMMTDDFNVQTRTVAETLGVSSARVSQMRREINQLADAL